LLPGLPSSVQSWMPESLPFLFRSPAMNDGGGADRCGCASGFPVALAAHRPPGFLERFARWAAGKPHCSKEWFKGMVQGNGSREWLKGNCSMESVQRELFNRKSEPWSLCAASSSGRLVQRSGESRRRSH
jgi:hypothetical protein